VPHEDITSKLHCASEVVVGRGTPHIALAVEVILLFDAYHLFAFQ
jgi:hypothetical protein